MKLNLSWRAYTIIRLSLILFVLSIGASLIHSELGSGKRIERKIRLETEEATNRIDKGERTRRFRAIEKDQIAEIEREIGESILESSAGFKGVCLPEMARERLIISEFKHKKPPPSKPSFPWRGRRGASSSPEENSEDSPKKEDQEASFEEIPFSIKGEGFYGPVLRFADFLHTHKTLVVVERFGISRASIFQSLFEEKMGRRSESPRHTEPIPPEKEKHPELHSFLLEGKIFARKPERGERE